MNWREWLFWSEGEKEEYLEDNYCFDRENRPGGVLYGDWGVRIFMAVLPRPIFIAYDTLMKYGIGAVIVLFLFAFHGRSIFREVQQR